LKRKKKWNNVDALDAILNDTKKPVRRLLSLVTFRSMSLTHFQKLEFFSVTKAVLEQLNVTRGRLDFSTVMLAKLTQDMAQTTNNG
jgi:putative exporter of polyketide antibiotics